MLGEELWISSRARDSVAALSMVTSLVAVVALLATQVALTLVYWWQMVRYLERHR